MPCLLHNEEKWNDDGYDKDKEEEKDGLKIQLIIMTTTADHDLDLMVSVDVKHHVYLLIDYYNGCSRSWYCGVDYERFGSETWVTGC